MNYIKECHTIEVFKDHLLINSEQKLDLRDIYFERIIVFTPPGGSLIVPEYDAGCIKDIHGKLLYKIYFKVIWHTVLDSSAFDFKELIDKLKQKENEGRANF